MQVTFKKCVKPQCYMWNCPVSNNILQDLKRPKIFWLSGRFFDHQESRKTWHPVQQLDWIRLLWYKTLVLFVLIWHSVWLLYLQSQVWIPKQGANKLLRDWTWRERKRRTNYKCDQTRCKSVLTPHPPPRPYWTLTRSELLTKKK